jgi:hypothetical protein
METYNPADHMVMCRKSARIREKLSVRKEEAQA